MISITEQGFHPGMGSLRGALSGLGDTPTKVSFPASAIAVMLGDLGYYTPTPPTRVWDAELQSSALAFATDNEQEVGEASAEGEMVSFISTPGREEFVDFLAEAWIATDRGQVQDDVVYVGDLAEILYTLGYYNGPPLKEWTEEATIALGAWADDHPDRDGIRPSVQPNIIISGSSVKMIRLFPSGVYNRLADEYLQTLHALATGMDPGVTVTQVSSEDEEPQPQPEPSGGEVAPSPTPEKPPRTALASMVPFGVWILGGLAAFGIGWMIYEGSRR